MLYWLWYIIWIPIQIESHYFTQKEPLSHLLRHVGFDSLIRRVLDSIWIPEKPPGIVERDI